MPVSDGDSEDGPNGGGKRGLYNGIMTFSFTHSSIGLSNWQIFYNSLVTASSAID